MRCLLRLWSLELAVALAFALAVHAMLGGRSRPTPEPRRRRRLRDLEDLDTLVGVRSDNGSYATAA